jgi:hypothetical protein
MNVVPAGSAACPAVDRCDAEVRHGFESPVRDRRRRGNTVYVPSLPGCISEGDTVEEARQNIREAITLYFEPADDLVAPAGGFGEEIAV